MLKKISLLVFLFLLFSCGNKKQSLSFSDTPYTFPVKTFMYNNYPIAYMDEGVGTPLIFIHGLSTSAESFSPLYPFFIKAGYRVIGIDLLGYGKSAKPKIDYGLDHYPPLLSALCQHLKISRPVLIGHSMGAAVAQLSALKNPEAYQGLILYTPGGMEPVSPDYIPSFMKNYDLTAGKKFSQEDSAIAYYKSMATTWTPALESFLQFRLKQMRHPEWALFYDVIKQNTYSILHLSRHLVESQDQLKLPILVLFAENDPLILKRFVLPHLSRGSQWEVLELPQISHMFQMEKPEAVFQASLKFLQSKNIK